MFNCNLSLDVYKQTLDHVSDAIAIVSPDGRILYANRQFCQEYDIDLATYEGSFYSLLTTIKTLEEFEEKVDKIRAHGGSLVYQARYRSAINDTDRVHQVSAFIIHNGGAEMVCFFMQDITEVAESRDRYSELSVLLDTILDNLPVYVFVKDVERDFRYVYWNKAFADFSKIPSSRVIGRTDYEVFPDYADAKKFRDDDLEVIETHEPINRHETYVAADGTMRIVQTFKTLLPRGERGPLLIGVSWDITNMQNIEQELVRERIEAEASDRLKSTFLANMSHEIRTPLNAIVGFSGLLADTDDIESRQMYSDIIKQNSDVLLQLINDILDLSKIEAGTLEYIRRPFNLNDVFTNAYETLKERTAEGVELVFENGSEAEKIIVTEDQNRITQVVDNLITNATKFTSTGSIRFGYTVEDDCIRVYVKDTGSGIAADKIDKVFDRFVKLNNQVQGTGLGLAICKLIVNTFGGTIWVESELGQGSTFYFTIPYKASGKHVQHNTTHAAAPVVTTEEKAKDDKGEARKVILVAEDVSSNFLLIKSSIGTLYDLKWAKDGVEALKAFKEHRPDMILMDIKMPNMNGYEATRLIRTYDEDLPIVALTAFAFESDKQKAYEAGCTDYMTKPVTRDRLLKLITKYLG